MLTPATDDIIIIVVSINNKINIQHTEIIDTDMTVSAKIFSLSFCNTLK